MGSSIDQCSHEGLGSSSSWALSHTVTTSRRPGVTSASRRGVALVRSSPARRPAWTAPGCTRAAGWVPALSAGCSVSVTHNAAASCERAEFWVHTNRTGWRRKRPPETSSSRASRCSCTYRRRWSPLDRFRVISPTPSRTSRWWANRFDSDPVSRRNSTGERSEAVNSSMIAKRIGSPNAACRAARTASEGGTARSSHSLSVESTSGVRLRPRRAAVSSRGG